MDIKTQLNDAMKQAMKANDDVARRTTRMALAAIKQAEAALLARTRQLEVVRGISEEITRELDLARVEYGTRGPVGGIGRTFLIKGTWAANVDAALRAEVGGAVDGVVELDVDAVQAVEGFHHELAADFLADRE